MFQRPPIESTTHFDPMSASHFNHQSPILTRIAMRIPPRPNYFDRNHRAATRCLTLVRSTTIFVQRSYSKITFLTERFPR